MSFKFFLKKAVTYLHQRDVTSAASASAVIFVEDEEFHTELDHVGVGVLKIVLSYSHRQFISFSM